MRHCAEDKGVTGLEIALIRHGSTAGNLRGAYIGSTDEPLSPTGREELQLRLSCGDYPAADRVFSSPLLRCRQTAELLYPEPVAVPVNNLREREFGLFEGMTHAQIIQIPGYSEWGMTEESMVFPQGEHNREFHGRCLIGFQDVVSCSSAGEVVAVICHGGVIMELLAALDPAGPGRFDRRCEPGSGFLLQYHPADCIAADIRRIGR